MQYGLAFRYFIGRTGGTSNTLLVTLCSLIPIIGPIVISGYRAYVATALIADPELQRHPTFSFDRFSEYLSRGIWPFLTSLIVSMPFVVAMWIAMAVGFGLGAAAKEPAIGFIAIFVFVIVGSILVSMLSVPMIFHAELVNRFDLPGAFRFALSFWKLVPGPAVITAIVFIPLAYVVVLLGLLLCIVGVFPASILVQMAGQHLMVQLYREYLERGGEPIPIYQSRSPRDEGDSRGDEERAREF